MSFDFNMVASSFKPKVENTFLGKGGGGGNTGYFQQEKKKKDDKNSDLFKFSDEEKLEQIAEKALLAEEPSGLLDKMKTILNKIK